MYTYERKAPQKSTGFTGYMVDEASTIKSFDYRSIYRSKEFNEACNKYFDNTDTMTRNILLSVNEADQNVVMQSLCSKLYQHIVDKVDDIDFGTIPESKGDITKIEHYDQINDCVQIMAEILQQYHQDTSPVEVISIAMANMVDRIPLFTKAYKLNVEMPMIIYNTMALAIVSATSLMISSCIEFVKLPDDQGFEISLNKTGVAKSKENVLYHDLQKFNKLCSTGEFDKAMDYVIKGTSEQFLGGASAALSASSAVAILAILLLIIPVIRELIFFFYYSRAKISDYFDTQSSLLLINSYNIENSLTRDEKTRKEIAGKQRKVADAFKKISDAVKIKTKTGEQKAQKDIKELDSKKYKTSDVLKDIPDSSNSVLF